MASAGAVGGASPSMREVRDHVLSVLLSSGGRQDPASSQTAPQGAAPAAPTPAPYQYPQVPPPQAPTHAPGAAPVAYPHIPSHPHPLSSATPAPPPAWGTPQTISPVSWATPLRPVEADVRVAELTAGLVAASDVERRQADTIRRLAAQLEKAERLERRHPEKRPARATALRFDESEKKVRPKRQAGRASERAFEAPSPGSVIDDSDASDGGIENFNGTRATSRSRPSPSPARTRSSSRQTRTSVEVPESSKKSASRKTSSRTPVQSRGESVEPKSKPKSHSRPRRSVASGRGHYEPDDAADDAESFAELRRKVLALESQGSLISLADQNAALRADRSEAREEAGQLASSLREIRQTASALMADREELLATITQLRLEATRRVAQSVPPAPREGEVERVQAVDPARGGSQPNAVTQPSQPENVIAQPSPDHGSEEQRKDSKAFNLSPGAVRFSGFESPTPCQPDPVPVEDQEETADGASVGGGSQVDSRKSGEDSRMESELRTELRSVLDENAALSNRIIELENRATRAGVQGDSDGLEDLQTEVLVLASVAECIDFTKVQPGDSTRTQMTHLSGLVAGESVLREQLRFDSSDVGPSGSGLHRCRNLKELAEEVATIRQSIALKYGEWLNGGAGSDGFSLTSLAESQERNSWEPRFLAESDTIGSL